MRLRNTARTLRNEVAQCSFDAARAHPYCVHRPCCSTPTSIDATQSLCKALWRNPSRRGTPFDSALHPMAKSYLYPMEKGATGMGICPICYCSFQKSLKNDDKGLEEGLVDQRPWGQTLCRVPCSVTASWSTPTRTAPALSLQGGWSLSHCGFDARRAGL